MTQKIVIPKGFTPIKTILKRYKLVPHLDKVIGETDEEWEFKYTAKEQDDAWHPSGHCTPSALELYQIATSTIERNFPASTRKTFMVGHFWHQWLQHLIQNKLGFCDEKAIERRGKYVWGEGPFHWVRGSADVAPCVIPKHGEFIVDFKTMNASDFKSEAPPVRYADKWECQMNTYMDFFGIDRTLVVGICKDSPHEFKEWEYHRNGSLIQAIYDKWHYVSECLDENTPPTEIYEVEPYLQGTARESS